MRITVVHLSDIHFREDANPIASRANSIFRAINAQIPDPEALLIIISGDIAFSGKPEEYKLASQFLRALETCIREFKKDIEVAFACIPGNHDCFLPTATDQLRQALIIGIEPSMDTNEPDREIMKQLLAAQNSYISFQDDLTSRSTSSDERLCKTELIVLGDVRIQLNLYNTALLSQRDEKQGSLRVPVAVFDLNVRPLDDAAIIIGVVHHTYLWLESANALEFRRHMDDNVDFVLSGHQHLEYSYIKQNLDGQRALYLEGSALQDRSNPASSGFNVVELEFPARKQRITHFEWKADHYEGIVKSDWSELLENRAVRHEFRISDDFQRFLNDAGAGYSHKRKRELSLRDIYVYPDLSVRRPMLKQTVVEVTSDGFHAFLQSSDL